MPNRAVGISAFRSHVSVFGSYTSTVAITLSANASIWPPIVNTFPSTTHVPKLYRAVGMSALCVQVFSAARLTYIDKNRTQIAKIPNIPTNFHGTSMLLKRDVKQSLLFSTADHTGSTIKFIISDDEITDCIWHLSVPTVPAYSNDNRQHRRTINCCAISTANLSMTIDFHAIFQSTTRPRLYL